MAKMNKYLKGNIICGLQFNQQTQYTQSYHILPKYFGYSRFSSTYLKIQYHS